MKVAVIGAGLAGLATAAFLKKDGHDVTVFERDAKLEGRGLGIQIQPLGVAVLRKLGVIDKVIAGGTRINSMHTQKIKKNKRIADMYYNSLERGLFAVGIHRPKLFDILLDNARNLGVNFVAGCAIQDAIPKGTQRQLVDGCNKDQGSFDLVVDASGYRSPLRKYATVTRHEDYVDGYVCFTADDDGSLGAPQNASSMRYMDKHSLTIVPIGKDPVSGKNRLSFFWERPVDKMFGAFDLDNWKKEVVATIPAMKTYIEQITSTKQLVFAHYADISLKTYHADKLVFVGDAAHSTSPLLGQSTSMGFVDALVLSKSLQREPNLQKALATYSAERKGHVKFQQNNSRTLTHIFQSVAPPVKIFRDIFMPKAFLLPGMRQLWAAMVARAENGPPKRSPLRKKYGI